MYVNQIKYMAKFTKIQQQSLKLAIRKEYKLFAENHEKDPKTYSKFPTIKYLCEKLKKDDDTIRKYLHQIADEENKILLERFAFERTQIVNQSLDILYSNLANSEDIKNKTDDESLKLKAGESSEKTIQSLAHLVYSAELIYKPGEDNVSSSREKLSDRTENKIKSS